MASPSGDPASSDLGTITSNPISHGSASHGETSEPAKDPTFQALFSITSPNRRGTALLPPLPQLRERLRVSLQGALPPTSWVIPAGLSGLCGFHPTDLDEEAQASVDRALQQRARRPGQRGLRSHQRQTAPQSAACVRFAKGVGTRWDFPGGTSGKEPPC